MPGAREVWWVEAREREVRWVEKQRDQLHVLRTAAGLLLVLLAWALATQPANVSGAGCTHEGTPQE